MHQRSPHKDFKVILLLLGMLIIPTMFTLLSVQHPVQLTPTSEDPTPYGYTWSLLFFIVPIFTISAWFYTKKEHAIQKKSFFLTILILVPFGFGLDFFFGNLFFDFPNSDATLRIYLPGYDFSSNSWTPDLPIEEFIFYTTGFIAILLIYVWSDEFWMGAYNVPDYREESKNVQKLIRIHWGSAVWGLILIAVAYLYKKYGAHSHTDGFPTYFTFLVVAAITPSFIFFDAAKQFINWRAFSFTFLLVTLISLMWEATLATPYGWWTYNSSQMMGVMIGAWNNLPLEASILWIAVSFTTVIVYEVIKIFLAMEKKLGHAMLGKDNKS